MNKYNLYENDKNMNCQIKKVSLHKYTEKNKFILNISSN